MLANDYGVRLSFHPHVGTAVELEPQIDRLLADTPLDLCFDTGHHAFWNQDPLAYMDKVRDRIAYMHLKNVDPAVRARVLAGELALDRSFAEGAMCPLPDGAVDIRAVMRRLDAIGLRRPRRRRAGSERDRQRRPRPSSPGRNLDFLAGLCQCHDAAKNFCEISAARCYARIETATGKPRAPQGEKDETPRIPHHHRRRRRRPRRPAAPRPRRGRPHRLVHLVGPERARLLDQLREAAVRGGEPRHHAEPRRRRRRPRQHRHRRAGAGGAAAATPTRRPTTSRTTTRGCPPAASRPGSSST